MLKTLFKSLFVSAVLMTSNVVAAENTEGESRFEVNINTAELDELDKFLKGIGTKKAKQIIDYREAHGDFSSIEELKNIKGIGDKIVEMNQDIIVL